MGHAAGQQTLILPRDSGEGGLKLVVEQRHRPLIQSFTSAPSATVQQGPSHFSSLSARSLASNVRIHSRPTPGQARLMSTRRNSLVGGQKNASAFHPYALPLLPSLLPSF